MLACKLVQCCMSTLVWDDEYILQHFWLYKSFVSSRIHPFGADRENFPILSWGKASGQIGNTSSPFQGLIIFVVGLFSPFSLYY
jgi:hypothetical protein